MTEPAEERLYSFEAIDHLDDETKRLYRLWLKKAISRAMGEGRLEVTTIIHLIQPTTTYISPSKI